MVSGAGANLSDKYYGLLECFYKEQDLNLNSTKFSMTPNAQISALSSVIKVAGIKRLRCSATREGSKNIKAAAENTPHSHLDNSLLIISSSSPPPPSFTSLMFPSFTTLSSPHQTGLCLTPPPPPSLQSCPLSLTRAPPSHRALCLYLPGSLTAPRPPSPLRGDRLPIRNAAVATLPPATPTSPSNPISTEPSGESLTKSFSTVSSFSEPPPHFSPPLIILFLPFLSVL